MAEDIDVPIVGKTKKTTAYVVGGGLVLVLGVIYYRNRKAASTAATTAATPQDQSQLDPATGYPYGSPQDSAALQAAASYNQPGSGYGYTGSGTFTPPASQTGIVSNPQWREAAVQELTQGGEDYATVSDALGKYITGNEVPDSEVTIVNQAIGAEGYPPQAGPNGYPPAIKHAAAVPPAARLATPRIGWAARTTSYATIGWNPVPGATTYAVLDNGKVVATVSGTNYRLATAHGAFQVIAKANGYPDSYPSNTLKI